MKTNLQTRAQLPQILDLALGVVVEVVALHTLDTLATPQLAVKFLKAAVRPDMCSCRKSIPYICTFSFARQLVRRPYLVAAASMIVPTPQILHGQHIRLDACHPELS